MTEPGFRLVADVSSDDPGAVGPVLEALIVGEISTTTDGFHIEATVTGEDAREPIPLVALCPEEGRASDTLAVRVDCWRDNPSFL
jgi:hypothetical protein